MKQNFINIAVFVAMLFFEVRCFGGDTIINFPKVTSSIDGTSQSVQLGNGVYLFRSFAATLDDSVARYRYSLVRAKKYHEPDHAFDDGLEIDKIIIENVSEVEEADNVWIVFSNVSLDAVQVENNGKLHIRKSKLREPNNKFAVDLVFAKMLVANIWRLEREQKK